MIRGFFDDSEQGEIFLIAGWVTNYETWERFTEEWRSVLDQEPAIKYFKHHEAKGEPPTGQFAGWPATQVETKITQLVDVICRHEMYGVVSGLNTATHAKAFSSPILSRKTLRSILKFSHHFQSCVFSVSAMVLDLQIQRGVTEKKVDVVFDEMDGLMAECIVAYDGFKHKLAPEQIAIAGSMTEADDKEVEALQAADLLAGQFTTRLRIGHPEEHWRRLHAAHELFFSPAYLPNFEHIPTLVSAVNVAWSGLQLAKLVERTQTQVLPEEDNKE
jgi:hypothetical protein